MTIQQQYETETRKSPWAIKKYTYTEEYTQWVKAFLNTSDDPAAKIVRQFSNNIKNQQTP